MLSKRSRKSIDMALVAGLLVEFSAILHPKGSQMENICDETRRKSDGQLGEPLANENREMASGRTARPA